MSIGSPSRMSMVLVRGGTFAMGSDAFYPEESPVREVAVDDLWVGGIR